MSALDWLDRPPMVEDIDPENGQDEGEVQQVWEDFEETSERFCKSLYYGRLPSSDRLSLPVTELCVTRFNHLGIDNLEARLDKLDVDRAAKITRDACASPTSLVLALMYLDRLRSNNLKYLHSVSSTDLFLVSLMVASKFLHDDGEEDEVFNEEWAKSGGLDKKDLNKLELDFLTAIDWNVYASAEQFEAAARNLESAVAAKKVGERPNGWTTYTDLLVLSRRLQLETVCLLLYECTLKVTAICAVAYAASLMTMLGTCHVVSRSSLFGPSSSVQESIQTLHAAFSAETPVDAQKNDSSADVLADTDNNDFADIDIEGRNLSTLVETANLSVCESRRKIPNHYHYYRSEGIPENFNRVAKAVVAMKMAAVKEILRGPRLQLGRV